MVNKYLNIHQLLFVDHFSVITFVSSTGLGNWLLYERQASFKFWQTSFKVPTRLSCCAMKSYTFQTNTIFKYTSTSMYTLTVAE